MGADVIAGARRSLAAALTRAAHRVAPALPRPSAAYFRGARADQWNGDWSVPQLSSSQILRADLTTLVDRSRDLAMNNATAARIINLFPENISGKDGILYQAAVKFANGSYDKRANTALETSWYRWAENRRLVSADRKLTWFDVETLWDRTEARDGEAFVRHLPGFDNAYRYAVQVLDTDQVDRNFNQDADKGRNAIIMGVEVDAWGAVVAYHVWPNHPSEMRRRGERLRVPADEIEHTFLIDRAGQVRGVPYLAPAIVELMQLGEYTEAEVKAARTAAAKMGFLQNEEGADTLGFSPADLAEFKDAVKRRGISWTAEPGVIEQLGPGQTFKEWNPLHPSGNFEAFERTITRRVASSQSLSHMSVSGDLSQTSFASGRIGYLAEQNVYRKLQQRKITNASKTVHARWLSSALLAGQVNYPSYDADRLSASMWHPRSFPGVDEAKETDAWDHKVAMGTQSLTRMAAAEGRDIEEVFAERAREIELAAQYGVPLALYYGQKAAVGQPTTTRRAPDDRSPDDEQDADADASDQPVRLSIAG